MQRPSYAGRWVVVKAIGPALPSEKIPEWIMANADCTRPCSQQTTALYVADPAVKGSLHRLPDPAGRPDY